MAGSVLPRNHGFPIDHVAIAARDTEEAVDWLRKRLGADPHLTDPEPGQWYWSAALGLGEDSFLEVLGPNPQHQGFNPIKEIIAAFDEPQLLFWYVATDDFDAFAHKAAAAGVSLERVETVDYERNGQRVDYTRGILGPGFESPRACVIQWRHRIDHGPIDQFARLTGFELTHPKAEAINQVYRKLGIDVVVHPGPSTMTLMLEGPNGALTLSNPGMSFAGMSAVMRMAALYVGYLFKRKQS